MDLREMLNNASKFHGHICPGLAIGVVASKIALESAKRAEDEELVAIVENDACGVDGIQVLTGCTYGKGNLIHLDYGKSVYTFYNRNTHRAVRLSLKPDLFSVDSEQNKHRKELFDKVRDSSATQDERMEHENLREERISSILSSGEAIFEIQEVEITPPEKARIFNDILCDSCGEPVMSSRIVQKDGKKLCIPCSKKHLAK